MDKDAQKKQWQADARQLKKDLDSREKVVQKREVEIKLPNQSKKKKTSSTKTAPPSLNDNYLRKQLGL